MDTSWEESMKMTDKEIGGIITALVLFISIGFMFYLAWGVENENNKLLESWPRYYYHYSHGNKYFRVFPQYIREDCVGSINYSLSTFKGMDDYKRYEKPSLLKWESKDSGYVEIEECKEIK
jgi:hypothetical protein